jgi:hypothetical protein
MPPRSPKGAPTSLNVWVLGKVAAGRREFPNRIEPTSAPHLRRCLRAGLVELAGRRTLRLTEAGLVAVNADESVPYVSAEE